MKYDAEIETGTANTSHAVVVDLVGADKQVLDVGCSTGYLGRALVEQGCVVDGVEVDTEAAARAAEHLREVLVADLDDVGLTEVVADRRYDVIVFADVLEHLKDPLAVLRSSAALLRPGGYVVLSIPNVAHGSLRLALLAGRFEYTDVGLLDSTHIRFFTRSTLMQLMTAAGFVAEEMRRTTAGIFATEIVVEPSEVTDSVMGLLDADEDAETYQFVCTAVPMGDRQDVVQSLLARREAELSVLRRQLSTIVRYADLGAAAPTVGILRAPSSPLAEVRAMVVEAELRRRLDGFRILLLEPDAAVGGSGRPEAVDGTPLDAVVLVGDLGPREVAEASRLAADGVAVSCFGAVIADDVAGSAVPLSGAFVGSPGGQGDAERWPPVPDPAVAASDVVDVELMGQRVELLKLLGSLPAHGGVLLGCLDALRSGRTPASLRGLRHVADELGLELVVVDAAPGTDGWQLTDAGAVDLLSVMSRAELVVSDDPVVVAAALSLGRPVIGISSAHDTGIRDLANWLDDPDLLTTSLAAVASARPLAIQRAADATTREVLLAALGQPLDRLAAVLVVAAGRRVSATIPARLLQLQDERNALASANAGLLRRLRAERVAFGRRATALLRAEEEAGRHARTGGREAPGDSRPHEVVGTVRGLIDRSVEIEALRLDNEALVAEAEAARQELRALLATRTFRTLQPARDVYRRLRSVLH